MKPIRRIAIALFATYLALAATDVDARSIADSKWIRMDSQNFTIYSTVNKLDTRDLIRHLEAARSLLPAVTGNDMASEIPTQIFVVSKPGEYEQLGLDMNEHVAVFRSGLRRNFIVLIDTHGYEGVTYITTAYFHYLLRNVVRLPFPRWYEKGYAVYVGNSTLRRKEFTFGRTPVELLYFLSDANWLDMAKVIDSRHLLSEDEPKGDLKFELQSWLLVHYLLSRSGGVEQVSEELATYMDARRDGANDIDAFEAAFGLEVDDLEQLLKRYLDRGKFSYATVPVDRTIRKLDPEVSRVDRPAIAVELGEFLLASGISGPNAENSQLASPGELFSAALGDEATRPRAEMGLARLAELAGDAETAEQKTALGARLAPGDLSVQLDAADLWLSRAVSSPDASGPALRHAEPYLRNALAIDPGNAEVVFSTGRYLLLNGETAKGLQHLESAAYRAPSVLRVQWTLAFELARHGFHDKALHYARELLYTRETGPSLARGLRELIAELESQ